MKAAFAGVQQYGPSLPLALTERGFRSAGLPAKGAELQEVLIATIAAHTLPEGATGATILMLLVFFRF